MLKQQKGKIIIEVAVSLQIVRSTTEPLGEACHPGASASVPGSPIKNHVNVQFARKQTNRNYQNIVAIGIDLYLNLST